jgi:hypothetical protein
MMIVRYSIELRPRILHHENMESLGKGIYAGMTARISFSLPFFHCLRLPLVFHPDFQLSLHIATPSDTESHRL